MECQLELSRRLAVGQGLVLVACRDWGLGLAACRNQGLGLAACSTPSRLVDLAGLPSYLVAACDIEPLGQGMCLQELVDSCRCGYDDWNPGRS